MQYLENEPLSDLKLIVDIFMYWDIIFNIFDNNILKQQSFKISLQYLENEPLNGFKPIVDIIYG